MSDHPEWAQRALRPGDPQPSSEPMTPEPAPTAMTGSATRYVSADQIITAIETAKARSIDRLCLANSRGMLVEILAEDLLATLTRERERADEAKSASRLSQALKQNALDRADAAQAALAQATAAVERLREALTIILAERDRAVRQFTAMSTTTWVSAAREALSTAPLLEKQAGRTPGEPENG